MKGIVGRAAAARWMAVLACSACGSSASAPAGGDAGGPRDAGDAASDSTGRADSPAPARDGGSTAESGAYVCPKPKVSLLVGDGGRAEWSPTGAQIAYDKVDHGACYDVWTAASDGSKQACLTCGVAGLPPNNKGLPSYYPGGRYLVFEVEHATHPGAACSTMTNPGAGGYSDLYVFDQTKGTAALLYPLPATSYGVLHPRFSHDGTKLLWSEEYGLPSLTTGWEVGRWMLNIADVAVDDSGAFTLSNVTKLLPTATTGEGFVEGHGFLPDDTALIFSYNLGYTVSVASRLDEFTSALDGTARVARTSAFYNEHGQVSPGDGSKLVRMTDGWSGVATRGTEFVETSLDGSTPACQLSHFNTPGYPESRAGTTTLSAKLSFSPDGSMFIGYNEGPPQTIWLFDLGAP